MKLALLVIVLCAVLLGATLTRIALNVAGPATAILLIASTMGILLASYAGLVDGDQ